MIIVRLSGGLGNQMFQYAFGKALSMRRGTELKIDVSRYGTHPEFRKYQLDAFRISADLISPREMRQLGLPPFDAADILSRIRRRLFRMWESRLPLSKKRIILEPRFTYCPEILDAGDDVLFIGDWQSEKYFVDAAETMREEFSLSSWTESGLALRGLIDGEKRGTPISLHVRRGDNVSVPHSAKKYGTPPTGYYIAAVAKIAEFVKDPVYYIFSDDAPWVEENLSSLFPRVIVSGQGATDIEEMILMSLCHHHIIANSTFSWWGSWLDSKPGSVVIAPKRWFLIGTDTSDLIPDGWIQI